MRKKRRMKQANRLLKAAKNRLQPKTELKKHSKRYLKRINKLNKKKGKSNAFDDDCICIEPKTECVVIDEDSNCDSGCVDLTTTDFGPEITSSPSLPYKKIMPNCNAKLINTEIQHKQIDVRNDLFFKDVSKMPLFKIKQNNTPKSKLRVSKSIYSDALTQSTSETDVIIIDDSLINTTMKSETDSIDKTVDDSVEYISWSSPKALPDFIPIHNDSLSNTNQDNSVIFVDNDSASEMSTNKQNCNKRKVTLKFSNPSTPKNTVKKHRESLFTRSEKKLLNEYNQNTYNPNSGCEQLTEKRMVIIDGSNIAFSHSLNHKFSVKGLTICIEYFIKMGHEVKAVLPQFRLHRTKSSDPETLETLQKEGKIVLTPCKNLPGKSATCYDDRFILQLAYELDAVVISNDNYRDLLNENPAFKKIIENRVIGYTWCNDIFLLPKDPYGKWGPTLQSILNRNG